MASNLAPLDSTCIDFASPASVATMLAAGPTIQQHVSVRLKMHSSTTLLKLSLDEFDTSRSSSAKHGPVLACGLHDSVARLKSREHT